MNEFTKACLAIVALQGAFVGMHGHEKLVCVGVQTFSPLVRETVNPWTAAQQSVGQQRDVTVLIQGSAGPLQW